MELNERKIHSIEFSLEHNLDEDEFDEVGVFKSIIKKCKDKSSKIGFKRMFNPDEIQIINGLNDILNNEESRVKEVD